MVVCREEKICSLCGVWMWRRIVEVSDEDGSMSLHKTLFFFNKLHAAEHRVWASR